MDKKLKQNLSGKELELVRDFLQRNNLEAIAELLKKSHDRIHGAKITAGAMHVPADTHTAVSFTNTEWDSDGFFQVDALIKGWSYY